MNFTPTVSQLKMLASLRGNLWMIHEEKAIELALSALQLSERNAAKESYSDEELSDYYTIRAKSAIDDNGIAHIEVRGAMLADCASLYERCGLAIRYSTIINDTNAAVQQGAKGIIYKVNSPGGTVSGNIEASELVADLPVPTVSYCEGLACSAAYKFASGTDAIVASKSALIGNIGTILSWSDWSKFREKWGIETKAITSEGSDLKSTFHLEPNEEQLKFLQESVNESGAAFKAHVIAGRAKGGNELSDEVWRAGWYAGERTLSLGLVDAIGTYSEAYGEILKLIQSPQTTDQNLTSKRLLS